MPAIPAESLIDKALSALIAFMQAHQEGPVTGREKDLLRFALAFLYAYRTKSPGPGWKDDRDPFDEFWRAAIATNDGTDSAQFGRFQSMRSAYGAVARMHGRDYW